MPLHAARDNEVRRTGTNDIVRQHRRLHAGAAHLVDGRRAGGIGQLCAARGLAGGRLPLAGRQHATHEYFIDAVRLQARTFDSRADDVGAKLMCAEGSEVALKAAERCACGGEDDDRI